MDVTEIADVLLNAPPVWMREKPCAMCGVLFIPADPRQELCPPHHRALTSALAERLTNNGDAQR